MLEATGHTIFSHNNHFYYFQFNYSVFLSPGSAGSPRSHMLVGVAFFFSTPVTCPNCPVWLDFSAKRTANPAEVVATPLTEMLQYDTPWWSCGIFYVFCLLFGQYTTTTTHLAKNVLIDRFCAKYLNEFFYKPSKLPFPTTDCHGFWT